VADLARLVADKHMYEGCVLLSSATAPINETLKADRHVR